MRVGNALDTVRLTRLAEREVNTWAPAILAAVYTAMPAPLTRRYAEPEWYVAVALFQGERETAPDAATRLALYLTTYHEHYHRYPSLDALQQEAARRILEEPR